MKPGFNDGRIRVLDYLFATKNNKLENGPVCIGTVRLKPCHYLYNKIKKLSCLTLLTPCESKCSIHICILLKIL